MNHWNHKDFDIFESNVKGRINKTWECCGSDKTGKVKGGYTFNELGYRGDRLKTFLSSQKKLATFGCSHTLGVGVGNEETWPHLLSKEIDHKHINFGIQGLSNDTISRSVLTYVETLTPDLVVVLWTYPHRREYITKDGQRCSFIPDSKWYWWDSKEGEIAHKSLTTIQNDEYDNDNLYRNQLLVENFLKNRGIRYISYTIGEFRKNHWLDVAVDKGHAGVKSNKSFVKNICDRYL